MKTSPTSWRQHLLHLPSWIRQRSQHGAMSHAHVSRQRRMALWSTVFSAIRTAAWIVCILLVLAHDLGAGGSFLNSFIRTSSTVLFVTLISFYCNAATDFASTMAGMAALFSADSHVSNTASEQPQQQSDPADPVPQLLAQMRDEMHNLAEATRAAVKP